MYAFATESDDLDVMLADSPHIIMREGVRYPCFYDISAADGAEPGGAAAQVLQMETASVKAEHFPDIKEGETVEITEPGLWTRDYIVLQAMQNGGMKELILQAVL